MEERKTVIVIPKIEKPSIDESTGIKAKKKVCAYARVSTDLEDQKNSFEAQLDEYSTRIQANPDWEFVKLYSDEGISGTSYKKREGFKEMLEDAMNGKIDMILTKSISRFARNTVDCLTIVRKLRAKGVEVVFEKETLSSLDDRCEMMLTMFASFAQEESHSISENVKWGIRKRMAKGTRKINANYLLGYYIDGEGKLAIDEEEAKIVRQIYQLFIAGSTYREICEEMEKGGHLTQTKKEIWTVNNVRSILSNEKYCGDILQQKTYIRDFLGHESVKNNGQVQQYLIVRNHEPIVSKDTFVYVQNLKKYRISNYNNSISKCGSGPTAGLLICSNCLRTMKKITTHPGTTYSRAVLTCKADLKNNEGHKDCSICNTLPYDLTVKAIKVVLDMFSRKSDDDMLKDTVSEAKSETAFYERQAEIKQRIAESEKEMKDLIKRQIEESADLNAYAKRYKEIQSLIAEEKQELESLSRDEFRKHEREILSARIDKYINGDISLTPIVVNEFLSKAIRKDDNSIRFILKSPTATEEWIRSNMDNILKMKTVKKGTVTDGENILFYDVVRLEDSLC